MKDISFKSDVLPLKDKIFRLALRITLNRQDAEDVVQETLIKIWNRREHWDEIESLEAWGLTIARNMAIDAVRKQEKNRTLSIEENASQEEMLKGAVANTVELSTHAPYEQMHEKERLQLVKDLMNSLPEKQRTAMQLRDFEGKTYKEVAEIMDISEDQVKVNIFRARQFIKQKYNNISDYGL